MCEARIVTTVLRGSQLPTPLSFYLVYVIQEETYIRRILSEEETKAKPDPNASQRHACLLNTIMSFTVCMKVSFWVSSRRARLARLLFARSNPSSPRTHPITYLHITSVFDTRVMGDTVGRLVPDEQDHTIRTR